MQLPILSILIFFPLLGIGLLLFLDRKNHNVHKAPPLRCVCWSSSSRCLCGSRSTAPRPLMQFVERYEWIPSYGISYYYVGVDVPLLLIMLTTS